MPMVDRRTMMPVVDRRMTMPVMDRRMMTIAPVVDHEDDFCVTLALPIDASSYVDDLHDFLYPCGCKRLMDVLDDCDDLSCVFSCDGDASFDC